jgi:hypothetical protein
MRFSIPQLIPSYEIETAQGSRTWQSCRSDLAPCFRWPARLSRFSRHHRPCCDTSGVRDSTREYDFV